MHLKTYKQDVGKKAISVFWYVHVKTQKTICRTWELETNYTHQKHALCLLMTSGAMKWHRHILEVKWHDHIHNTKKNEHTALHI